jgi:hypothetical protein
LIHILHHLTFLLLPTTTVHVLVTADPVGLDDFFIGPQTVKPQPLKPH